MRDDCPPARIRAWKAIVLVDEVDIPRYVALGL